LNIHCTTPSSQHARPYVPDKKKTEFVTNNMVIVPHPPYPPDLAPHDFAFFPKLKMKLKGRLFETVPDIKRELQLVLDSTEENDFHGTSEPCEKRRSLCIRSQGDYFEGDGSQN
jgi:histone-lysine N-methyltransferase SETMAR